MLRKKYFTNRLIEQSKSHLLQLYIIIYLLFHFLIIQFDIIKHQIQKVGYKIISYFYNHKNVFQDPASPVDQYTLFL